MPRINGTSNLQARFLRSLVKNPEGPPASESPSPLLLRRWLKKPRFCAALKSLKIAIGTQRRLEMTFTALAAARTLREALLHPKSPSEKESKTRESQTADAQYSTPDASSSPPPPPPPHNADFQRRLCNDIFRAVRPRGPRSKRPIVLAPAPFDDCLDFLKHLHRKIPLGEALDYYSREYALNQDELNRKRDVPEWIIEAQHAADQAKETQGP